MADNQPDSVHKVDVQLASTLRGIHRTRWVILAATGLALVSGLVYQQVQIQTQKQQINNQRVQLESSCLFWGELSGLPVTVTPPAKVPSELGVGLVVYARDAYSGQSCGELPPADPSVIHWAAYYHLRLP